MTGKNRLSPFRIRWRIFAFLFGFGFIAYLQQKSITIAAEPMMPGLGLSQLQIGWLEQAFVIGYAVFQIPIGIFAERFGAGGALVLMGSIAFVAMIATPIAPSLFGGQALFLVLLGLQLLLGIAQAATFPVSAGIVPGVVSAQPVGFGGRTANDGNVRSKIIGVSIGPACLWLREPPRRGAMYWLLFARVQSDNNCKEATR